MATDRRAGRPEGRRGFRDDIQGMRALAVVAIMVFHAGISPYPGGFVTLDVFFVISGFLITSLLLKEIARTGTLSLRTFYERRARRILPAATAALIGTVVACWAWLSLVETQDATRDAMWAALFGANVRFAIEETDYFALDEPPSPLQHYWSLSVEEQFYAVLPLVLLGCVLLAARRRGRRRLDGPGSSQRAIVVALGLITVLSFAWSVHASFSSPQTAYFSTFTRTWEFGVGALLAVAAPRFAHLLTARARNLLAGAGLVAIVIACFRVTPETPFPGYVALLPVLGTGAVMVAGASLGEGRPPVVQRILGCTPMRVTGDMSYSLYLWHWPVLAVATQHLGRDLSNRGLVFALVCVVALSWASYRYVETPFRRGLPPRLGRGLVLYPAAVAAVVVTGMGIGAAAQQELDRSDPAIEVADYERAPGGDPIDHDDPAVGLVQVSARAAAEGDPVPGDLEPPLEGLRADRADLGRCDYKDPPWRRLCPGGDPDGDKTMVVLGDSHARHWIPALEPTAADAGYTTYYLIKSQCTPLRLGMVRRQASEPWQECLDFNQWAQERLEELEPDVVLISTFGSTKVEIDGEVTMEPDDLVPENGAGFRRLVKDVRPHTDRVVVLGDVPQRLSDIGECLGRRGADLDDCDNTEATVPARIEAESRRAARATGADYVATRQWFCADGVCPPVVGSIVPMRDFGHVTTDYAATLAEPMARALKLR